MEENEIKNSFDMTVISALLFSDSCRVRKIPGNRSGEAKECKPVPGFNIIV